MKKKTLLAGSASICQHLVDFPGCIIKPLQAEVVAGSDRLSLGDVIIQDCLDLINAS